MKGLSPLLCLVAAAVLAISPTRGAESNERGERQAGFALAQDVCAECHAVNKGERQSPHAQAPSFSTIANAPGMNGARLRVWFQSSHRSMPDLHISERQADDLVAYIVSLRTGK